LIHQPPSSKLEVVQITTFFSPNRRRRFRRAWPLPCGPGSTCLLGEHSTSPTDRCHGAEEEKEGEEKEEERGRSVGISLDQLILQW